ncbi:MAG: metal-sulfur cluster assembly factor [candidate division Zixibacteria bacterium]|nr:metal-sulfur cluster assembly factor [candidate division Zixibacteria bacterium]
MITKEIVLQKLQSCYDPEIPMVSIVDLGLIYDVRIDPSNNVSVDMTLTAQGCPMHQQMSRDAQAKLKELEGVGNVAVNVVWDPPWTPERMTAQARRKLGWTS